VGGELIQGPWRRKAEAQAALEGDGSSPSESTSGPRLAPGKMSLGFIIRDCAVALGHEPTADELVEWANHQQDHRGEYCVFGRPITAAEAQVILRHLARPVSVSPGRFLRRSGE
jgi:hypothetical protein